MIHHDTSDKRGIDVAFIYDSKRFKTKTFEIFHHILLKRTSTRDLLQVNFYTKSQGNSLICVGNHCLRVWVECWSRNHTGYLPAKHFRIGQRVFARFFRRAVAAGIIDSKSKAVCADPIDGRFQRRTFQPRAH